ncbi:hypothetical protein TNCV_205481 [Trichonephila clavipes]|nr:hypothetical protein TNCV_205481 [Trichonephila clavipes]
MSFTRKPGSETHRQTSRQEYHHIVRNANVQPTASSASTQAQIGAANEGTGLQWNGTRLSSAKNPDSISAVLTIVFVCEAPMVNASILPLLYSDTPLPHLVRWSYFFKKDNVRSNTARVSKDYFRTVTILPSPSRSPDLYPMDHMYGLWYGELGIIRV